MFKILLAKWRVPDFGYAILPAKRKDMSETLIKRLKEMGFEVKNEPYDDIVDYTLYYKKNKCEVEGIFH